MNNPPAARNDAAEDRNLIPVLCAATAVAMIAPGIALGVFDNLSTDDAMRLVEIRDLIGGQGWFDLTQHRLDPPGSPMHWSRLIDAPLAALMLALRSFLGAVYAEAITLVLWPMLMLVAALLLVSAIAARLTEDASGRNARPIAVVLAALSIPALIHFRAGAIDHHNVQIVLLLCFVCAAAAIEQGWINAAVAGASVSLSLAIGLEMLPAIAAACVAMSGLFVWRGGALRRQAFALALALTVCSAFLAILLIPPGSIAAPVCDAFGGPVLLLSAGGGLILMIATGLDAAWPTIGTRAAAVLGGSVALLGAFVAMFPECIRSPYAMVDPLVSAFWLDQVAETMSFATVLRLEPQKVAGFFGFSVLTLVVAAVTMMRGPARCRSRLVIPFVTLASLIGISIWQIRGSAAATVAAAPIFAACLATLWPDRNQSRKLLLVAAVASPAAFTAVGLAARPAIGWIYRPAVTVFRPGAESSCRTISSVAPLSSLRSGRIMAPIDMGPAILAATAHSVFAAPYHRNNDGNLAMIRTMLGTSQGALDILRDRMVDYVVMCAGGPEQIEFGERAPDGLAARLNRGEGIDFLRPLDLGPSSKLLAWRVEIQP